MRKLVFSFLIFIFSFSVLANDLNNLVYRADKRNPETVKNAKGFYPRGVNGSQPFAPPSDINLWEHVIDINLWEHVEGVRGGYISTTTSQDVAIRWNHNGYVYHIRTTPNFIDVNATLREYSPFPEQFELAALGGVRWEQVVGWEVVINGNIVGEFIPNPDYNDRLYGNFAPSGAQPQLAGFPDDHKAWNYEPWVAFASCELKSACSPNKSAQEFGTDWFWQSYQPVIATVVAVLD
ncbi:enterotoxin A family protein [Bartonella bovis]|uniref:enterotoxin A family protein n=1 Tax=Bartonella bovis TaxID=155194 RepID=UPI000C9A8C65|nr:enterotoxin A family protein [Bartonella bovis]